MAAVETVDAIAGRTTLNSSITGLIFKEIAPSDSGATIVLVNKGNLKRIV